MSTGVDAVAPPPPGGVLAPGLEPRVNGPNKIQVVASLLVPLIAILGLSAFSLGEASVPVYKDANLKHQIHAHKDRYLLLVLGRIYDVTKGKQFYALDEEYHAFCQGVDNTRAFLSVDFEKDGGNDLSQLTEGACLGIWHWSKFYIEKDELKVYPFLGLHEGRCFTSSTPVRTHYVYLCTVCVFADLRLLGAG